MRKGNSGERRKTEKKTESGEKTDENSGHNVIASSQPSERRPLVRRTLVPIFPFLNYDTSPKCYHVFSFVYPESIQ